jgi:hypothetical protein
MLPKAIEYFGPSGVRALPLTAGRKKVATIVTAQPQPQLNSTSTPTWGRKGY